MKIYRVYIPRMGVPYIDVRARSKAEAVAKAYSVTNTSGLTTGQDSAPSEAAGGPS